MVWRRSKNDGMEVTRGCSTSSMTSVDNSSNAGVEARVISSNVISGSMEAEGSNSLSLSSSTLMGNCSNAGVEARVISIRGSMEAQGSISSSISGIMRSGALVRLVSPIACGISLSPLRLKERQCTGPTCAHGVAPEGIGT